MLLLFFIPLPPFLAISFELLIRIFKEVLVSKMLLISFVTLFYTRRPLNFVFENGVLGTGSFEYSLVLNLWHAFQASKGLPGGTRTAVGFVPC